MIEKKKKRSVAQIQRDDTATSGSNKLMEYIKSQSALSPFSFIDSAVTRSVEVMPVLDVFVDDRGDHCTG